MEICCIPRRFPPMIPRLDRVPAFGSATVRCSALPNSENSGELSMGDRMFVLGTGFVGRFVAAELKTRGWAVSGSCTSAAKKKMLEDLGHHSYLFDANNPEDEILEILKNHTHLIISIPPVVGIGDPMLRHRGLLEGILSSGRIQWLAYLSSTSVYGDYGGSWVDEDYPPKPVSEVARARLAAEEEWLRLGQNLSIAAHVFRLGGIYGPGRSAVDTILKQEHLSDGQKTRLLKSYTSRIHVADIFQALHASILRPSPGKIYNIVDDDPAPRAEVFEYAKKLKTAMGEKRVSNARMKKELGVNLLHPSYRSGLRSIIEQMNR
ncbi:uncharacterized protein LOC127240731 isoform X2 [Andrographis paniculata]|uniref:uncharacterized protein LOC127240731 isoform X2 n=1 Tax=Andrographis paniculata TaxID=175694 RepID=UPI0021E81BAC|nr:uncharacterized protein LOC127240731 isoform X2 [Andrographis paniculata]